MKVEDIEKKYFIKTFIKEAKQIPSSALTSREEALRQKLINNEEMTEEEYEEVTGILEEFRAAIFEVKPHESLDALDEHIHVMKTEKEFLDILKEDKTLTVDLPVKNKKYRFVFDVKRLDDSRSLQSIQDHVKIFRNLSTEEQKTAAILNAKSDLTDHEVELRDELNKKIEERVNTVQKDYITTFLAELLKIQGTDTSFEERKAFWSLIDYPLRLQVFYKLEEKIGISDRFVEELFPFD